MSYRDTTKRHKGSLKLCQDILTYAKVATEPPRHPRPTLEELGSWASDRSYVGYYLGEYMITKYLGLDP